MVSECVLYQKKDSIAWIMLNRPHVLNALNRKLWRGIYDSLVQAEEDGEVRVVIITGVGRAFSVGDDIKEVANLETTEDAKTFFSDFAVPAIIKIVQLPKPVIAAVNGFAYGGGCEMVMLCDLVIASEEATFAIPEALIGAIPPIATVIGENVIGKLNTTMMMLTGDPITADEAKSIGLVNKVVPTDELRTSAEKLAKSVMRAAPSSIRAIKKLTYQRFKHKELMLAVEELVNIVQTKEGKEGHRAFVEKRLPRWVER